MAGAVDAAVIGAGPNGLVAANLLVDAGWEVVLLEAQPQVGGAVASDEAVRPGFVHDTFSSFYPLAAVSRTIRELELERHGLTWVHAPAVVGTPFADGTWALLHRTPEETASGLDELHAGDGEAWMRMCRGWQQVGDHIVGALLSPFPPVRSGVAAATRLRRAGGLDFVRMLLSPARSLARESFGGVGARMLLAGNAGHADIPLDAAGSGFIGWLLAMVGQHLGFPVPAGGAGSLTSAMARRLEERGGQIRTRTRAVRIVVRDGRAVAVTTEQGERVEVVRAVVADVTAPALYGGLVAEDALPAGFRSRMRRFEWDPATVKVDWALSGPVPWGCAPSRQPGTVHVCETMDEIALSAAQVAAGAVPARPYLLVGQMSDADPSRAPAGAASIWAYTHVPHQATSDAGGGELVGGWDHADVELVAERMQGRIEAYAPGFGDRVMARRVLGPRELQARNENLFNGALNAGTSGLHQQLVFRPVPGLGRAETPIRGLYLGSASAHPGGGVHGACGANAARAALWHDRSRRWPTAAPRFRRPGREEGH